MSPDNSSIKLRFSSIGQAMFFQVPTQLVAATGRGGSSAQIEHSPATLNQRIVRTHLSIETYLNGSLALPIQWVFSDRRWLSNAFAVSLPVALWPAMTRRSRTSQAGLLRWAASDSTISANPP